MINCSKHHVHWLIAFSDCLLRFLEKKKTMTMMMIPLCVTLRVSLAFFLLSHSRFALRIALLLCCRCCLRLAACSER